MKKRAVSALESESPKETGRVMEIPTAITTLEDAVRWAISYALKQDVDAQFATINLDAPLDWKAWDEVTVADLCMDIEEWAQTSERLPASTTLEAAEDAINVLIEKTETITGRQMVQILQKHLQNRPLP